MAVEQLPRCVQVIGQHCLVQLTVEIGDQIRRRGAPAFGNEERQSLSVSDEAPGYAVLAHQVSERSLLLFIIYPPKEFSDKSFKEHLGEEFLFVHEGQVEVDFMNERLILNRGDALHFNAQKPHRIRSVGEVLAQLLVVVQSIEE